MPVSLISGLAGTAGSNPDPGGLQAFADHLERAHEAQRQQAIQQLNFMMNLTKESGGMWTPDPQVLEKTAKQAGLPKGFFKGTQGPSDQGTPPPTGVQGRPETITSPGNIPGLPGATTTVQPAVPPQAGTAPAAPTGPMGGFEAIAAAERQKTAAATEQAQAQLAQTRASTASTEQQTALSQQTMRFAEANQQHLQTVRAAEDRIGAMAYPDTPQGRTQQLGDARIVALDKNLTPDQLRHLQMTPEEEAEFNKMAAADVRMTHSRAQLELASALGDLRVQTDEKTRAMRELTVDEINNILSGKAVPVGLVSKLKQQELALKTMEAEATRKRSDAEMIQAEAYGTLTKQQVKKVEAETELDLAKAKALHAKGIVTNYEDLMKAFDAVEKMKRSGQPLDPTLVKHLEDELARFYGGTPVETKGFIDRWMNRGYTFGPEPFPLPQEKGPGAAPSDSRSQLWGLATNPFDPINRALASTPGAINQLFGALDQAMDASRGGTPTPTEIIQKAGPEVGAIFQKAPDLLNQLSDWIDKIQGIQPPPARK